MFKPSATLLLTTLLSTSLLSASLLSTSPALADTLELPADAQFDVQVVDSLVLTQETPRREAILMRPAVNGEGTHRLPAHCIMVGNAQLDGSRVRITTDSITCIATDGSASEIYSGDMSAAAYGSDGSFGLAVCQDGRCELTPEQTFALRLASRLSIAEQENPSEQINIRRRQANGAGIANPIPAERPTPDE